MGLFNDLLGAPKKREDRDTTDAEINAILVPLRDRICDFKDATEVSWIHILPAVQKIGIRLHVQARGLEATRKLYAVKIMFLDAHGAIPTGNILSISKPPIAPERLAELNGMIWEIANGLIAKGTSAELVAQAFGVFVWLTAQILDEGELWTLKAILTETVGDLQSDTYES